MTGKIYITPEDISQLRGYTLRSSQRFHLKLRKQLTPRDQLERGKCKKMLTIAEYCKLTMEPYREIFFELRGEIPLFPSGS